MRQLIIITLLSVKQNSVRFCQGFDLLKIKKKRIEKYL